jgi:hypothetical protein
MAEVQIILILSFLCFFVLTRVVWVRIIKREVQKIEIHLPLLAIHLSFPKGKRKKKKKSSARAYLKIISKTIESVWDCEVNIKEIALPYKSEDFSGFTLVKPFGYQGLVYAAIAYLKTRARHIILEDNAIISSPDISGLHCYLTVKLPLLKLIYALIIIRRDIEKEKSSKALIHSTKKPIQKRKIPLHPLLFYPYF